MHNNIPTYDHSVPWVVFVLFSREEKEEDLGQKKKLEKLLAYHHRLVVEKGLPPSRLMEEHAAASPAPPANSNAGKQFKCDQCDFASDSQRGLKVHVGRSHKDPEVLRAEDHEVSLNLSEISEIRRITHLSKQTYLLELEVPEPAQCSPSRCLGCLPKNRV